MDLFSKIDELISKLNYDWFKQKESEFKSHPLFDPESNSIILINDSIFLSFVYTDKIDIQKDDKYFKLSKIGLREYCFLYLPIAEETAWGFYPDLAKDPKAYTNTLAYSLKIVEFVFKSIPSKATPYEVSTFVSKANQELRNLVDRLRTDENKAYNEVLDDFVVMIEINLNNKFKKEVEFAEMVSRYEDHLDFKLNQEQLVSLIYFMYRADFFKYSDRQFLDFCFKFFRFTNQKEKSELTSFSRLKAIQTKFSEITKADVERKKANSKVSSLEYVEDELRKVFFRRK